MPARSAVPAPLLLPTDASPPSGSAYVSGCGDLNAWWEGEWIVQGCRCGRHLDLAASGLPLDVLQGISRVTDVCERARLLREAGANAARMLGAALRGTRRGAVPKGSLIALPRRRVVVRLPDGTWWECSEDGRDPTGQPCGVRWGAHSARGAVLLAHDLTDEQCWRAARAPAREALAAALAAPPEVGERVPQDQGAWRRLPVGTVVRDARLRAPSDRFGRCIVNAAGEVRYMYRGSRTGAGRAGQGEPAFWRVGAQAQPWAPMSSWAADGAREGVVEVVGAPLADDAALAGLVDRLERRREAQEVDAATCGVEPGATIGADEALWRRLPPGSVVDTRDGSSCPITVRAEDGWRWVEEPPPRGARSRESPMWGPGGSSSEDMAGRPQHARARYVGRLEARPQGRAFDDGLADLGYGPALRARGRLA